MRRKVSKAFTLVEILIVVVILGILAAIVVPQFTNATQDSQAGNIKAQLKTLENQIELFNARNNGSYPNFANDQWGAQGAAGTMVGDSYIKTPPSNPAFPTAANRTTVAVSATAGVNGSATAAWVWNSADRRLYASYFDEANGVVTPQTP